MSNETMIQGETIWNNSRITDRPPGRIEFPDLIRFKGAWYCGFHEGEIHANHPSGRARIIRSSDGGAWETAALFEWDGADTLTAKLSVTAGGCLMANGVLAFVSKEPRGVKRDKSAETFMPEGSELTEKDRQQFYQLEGPSTPESTEESQVTRQSVTCLSTDGENWSSMYACPSGVNIWRWEVVWHNGMGYSVAYQGKDKNGTLYRTRDGKSWRVLRENFFPGGRGNEGALAFGDDGTAYCLLRDAKMRDPEQIKNRKSLEIAGATLPMLGVGKPPYYTEWEWRELSADYGPEHGGVRPVGELFRVPTGGPMLRRLRDGRLLAVFRMVGPGQDDGHVTLCELDPERALLTVLGVCEGSSYPGLAEHDGMVWITYSMPDTFDIRLAKVRV